MSDTPFKMKGITPLKHLIGKHPAKDGHTKADHKTRRKTKKEEIKITKGMAETFAGGFKEGEGWVKPTKSQKRKYIKTKKKEIKKKYKK